MFKSKQKNECSFNYAVMQVWIFPVYTDIRYHENVDNAIYPTVFYDLHGKELIYPYFPVFWRWVNNAVTLLPFE